MKKLLITFVTAALLTVCLCIPAFAADECIHSNLAAVDEYWHECAVCGEIFDHFYTENGYCMDCGFVCSHGTYYSGVFSYHVCSICSLEFSCTDYDGDFYCDVCGAYSSVLASGGCIDAVKGTGVVLLYRDTEHFVYCPEHDCLVPLSLCLGYEYPHTSSCSFSDGYMELSYASYESGVFDCPCIQDVDGALVTGLLVICCGDDDHYIYCPDCGAFAELSVLLGEATPHTGDDCEVCTEYSLYGITILGSLPASSPGIFSAITALVTAAVSWLSAFALCIISTPLFLIFVCCIFVGLGIGLIKRVIHP